ncbi:hypothetical protein GCM10027169_01790 [Gordonia jinhuaensis]|uniref:Transmembrane protein n=1 Tax=Gordonia jinhuaensis TaxID=1517702 RepID=A0A916T450_9ACTN|nr:hypothetical protein [Gordonia jinhuaensis]GGB28064.1 hypothetical protein GCM10011489_15320 [Gordonia jinhuaensis]
MSTHRRITVTVTITAIIAAVVIMGPLLGSGYFLWGDAVSTPRSFVTDTALGIGDLPPRAVPQDWFVALASHVIDGGVVVRLLLLAALVLLGVGCGRLAAIVLPVGGAAGAAVATIVAMWNPYVAERLLQGHWSLLLGVAALPWIATAIIGVSRTPTHLSTSWPALAAWLCVAGLTPTGSVMALIMALVVAGALIANTRTLSSSAHWRRVGGILVLWVLSAAPWLISGVVGNAPVTSDPAGVAVFSARAERLLGTVGSVFGLGGIWNADAVPASRQIGWALVATCCLLAVVIAGVPAVWRRRHTSFAIVAVGLAVIVAAVVVIAATTPGQAALRVVVTEVPGAGLLRDAQKWLGLALPGYAICGSGAVVWLGRVVPTSFAAAVAAILVIAPLPDLAWGVGGTLRPVHYPPDFAAVASVIPAGQGDVALRPPGTNRSYPFAHDRVSLDPLPRMLRAVVLESGELQIGDTTVDSSDSRATYVALKIKRGTTSAELARLGVGWVVTEDGRPSGVRGAQRVYSGEGLSVYRIPDPQIVSASTSARILAWCAHILWLLVFLAGVIGAATGAVSRSLARSRGGRDDQDASGA